MFRCSRKFSAGTTQIVWNVIRLHSITRGDPLPRAPHGLGGGDVHVWHFRPQPKKLYFIYFPTGFSENFCEWQTTSVSCHKMNYWVSHRRVVSSPAVLWDATRLLGKSVTWQHKKRVRRRISKGKWQRIIGRMRAQRDPSISTACQTG